ncbi:hypothetical protein MMC13_004358 [Lambiella insularis]|nr:hypothetical protein [Lambiella insularis]
MSQTAPKRLEPGMFRDYFAVFCIAEIPTNIIDRFLQKALDQPEVQSELCVMTSTDVDSITHSSRPPFSAFQSPFLGWTLDALNDFIEANFHSKEPLSEKFYIVLDKMTATSGNSCLLVQNTVERSRRYTEKRLSPEPGYEGDEKTKSVRSNFEEALQSVGAWDIGCGDMQEMIDG